MGGAFHFRVVLWGLVGRSALYLVLRGFLLVYEQYSREANFCHSLQLVTELLLITLMLFYLWLLQLLVTLFLNNR